jgi:predicted AAA+ superfamily ATPase
LSLYFFVSFCNLSQKLDRTKINHIACGGSNESKKTFFKLKDRPSYMSILFGHKDKKVVKVLTGVRRCGKSAILLLFSEKLLDLGISDRQIVRMNFESLKFDDINNYKALYTSVEKQIVKN